MAEFPGRAPPKLMPILRQGTQGKICQIEPDVIDWDLYWQWGDFVIKSGGVDEDGGTHFDADPKCPVREHVEAYCKRHGQP